MNQIAVDKRAGLGGSDVAALLGYSRFSAPIDIYRRIVEGKETEQNSAMRKGSHMEPLILDIYQENMASGRFTQNIEEIAKKNNSLIIKNRQTNAFTSKFYPYALCHCDGFVVSDDDNDKVIEAKNTEAWDVSQWGEQGTDKIPDDYQLQVQFYMGITGIRQTDLPVFIGNDFRIYNTKFNPDIFEAENEAAQKFWTDHILKKIPPPYDGTSQYSKYIDEMFNSDFTKSTVVATESQEELAIKLYKLKEQISALENDENKIKDMLKLALGKASKLESGQSRKWSITWSLSKDGTKTNWEECFRDLEKYILTVAPQSKQDEFKAVISEIIADKTTVTPGRRSFRTNFNNIII